MAYEFFISEQTYCVSLALHAWVDCNQLVNKMPQNLSPIILLFTYEQELTFRVHKLFGIIYKPALSQFMQLRLTCNFLDPVELPSGSHFL